MRSGQMPKPYPAPSSSWQPAGGRKVELLPERSTEETAPDLLGETPISGSNSIAKAGAHRGKGVKNPSFPTSENDRATTDPLRIRGASGGCSIFGYMQS